MDSIKLPHKTTPGLRLRVWSGFWTLGYHLLVVAVAIAVRVIAGVCLPQYL